MDLDKARAAILGCLGGSVGFLMIAMLLKENEFLLLLFGGVGTALFIGNFVLRLLFWRCPCCGKHLPGRRIWKMEYCPYCGGML